MTTPRTMCKLLADSLDALTPVERAVVARFAEDNGVRSPWLRALFEGLARQSSIDETRRSMVLAELEADHLRDVDAIAAAAFGPVPQRTEGIEWWPED